MVVAVRQPDIDVDSINETGVDNSILEGSDLFRKRRMVLDCPGPWTYLLLQDKKGRDSYDAGADDRRADYQHNMQACVCKDKAL